MVAVRGISQRADAALVSAPVVCHVDCFLNYFWFVSNLKVGTIPITNCVILFTSFPIGTGFTFSFVSGDDLTCPDGQNLVSSLSDFADFSLSNNMNQNTVS